MGENIDAFYMTVCAKESRYRATRRLMESEEFATFRDSKVLPEPDIVAILHTQEAGEVRKLIREYKQLDDMSTARLRELASAHKIYNYARLTRAQLIKEIRNVEKQRT